MKRILNAILIILFFLLASFVLSSQEKISIASFNLGVFGPSKAESQSTLAAIASIVSQFDVVAVQEIRDKEALAIFQLLNAVNCTSDDYAVAFSPRLGRTSSKEQYAAFYRKSLFEIEKDARIVPDTKDFF